MGMKLLILYASTEGQTRKIARHVCNRASEQGWTAELLEAADAIDDVSDMPDIARYDAVILAGSLHMGKYQQALNDLATMLARWLNEKPCAFLSVSLAAASSDPEDIDDLGDAVRVFQDETKFRPSTIEHVAGAFRFTHYDFFKRWAMRFIAYRKGVEVDASEDLELTDWAALDRFAERFLEEACETAT